MINPRILMVIAVFYPYVGGAEKQAQKLANQLLKKNTDVSIVTGRWSTLLAKYEEIGGLKIFRNRTNLDFFKKKGRLDISVNYFDGTLRTSSSRKSSVKLILRKISVRLSIYIYQLTLFAFLILKRKSYDIIHVHQVLYPAFIATLAGRILKKPVMAKVGSSGSGSDINHIKKLPGGSFQLRYILKKIDRLVCTTEKMSSEFIKEGIDSKRVKLIRNGVEIDELIRDYRSSASLVYLGRFIETKDVKTLILAFSDVIKKNKKELKLTLLGDGPLKAGIIMLIKELGIEDFVELKGMVKNPVEILKKSDIFVFPSKIEGLSNSLIEAMSVGLACIVTNIPGNIEVFGESGESRDIKKGQYTEVKCGLLFKPSDVEALAKAIDYIINERNTREKIGRNAYKRIKDEFDIDMVADRYLKLYEELLYTEIIK